MSTCFVIQPFDAGKFDKRYGDVFEPAIQEVGLEPYRVDHDPGATVPIEEIEEGIRQADVCFAEISTDNPNVWFELGFAIASGKEVVLVCSDDREGEFPFDIQHRKIITYTPESPRDFDALRSQITKAVKAAVEKQLELNTISEMSPVADTEGLSQHEIVALVTVAEDTDIHDDSVAASSIRRAVNKAGFTDVAVTLALRSLDEKEMVEGFEDQSYHGDSFTAYRITDLGMQWLQANRDQLVLRRKPTEEQGEEFSEDSLMGGEDDLPF